MAKLTLILVTLLMTISANAFCLKQFLNSNVSLSGSNSTAFYPQQQNTTQPAPAYQTPPNAHTAQ